MTQLVGDHALVANATGCSSIYGGSQPTTPWTVDRSGRGPGWANSLFEDNAEFGLGMRLALDHRAERARALVEGLAARLGGLAEALLHADQTDDAGIRAQRERVARLRERLSELGTPEARALHDLADGLVRTTVWIAGGDGWADEIGSRGVDHLAAPRRGRRPGAHHGVDRGRGRLGVRHRKRRARPRARLGPRRERAGAGHRGLLEHRWADVQVHPAWRGGEVRRRRQARAEEGPGPHGHDLRQRVR